MKKELIIDRWNFILYEENGIKIIDVDFFNSYVDYSRKFKLQGDELNYNFEQLKILAEEIRKSIKTERLQSSIKQMRNELFKHNWDFILYEENGRKIMRVVFYQSFTDTSKEFKLQGKELDYDFEQLKQLAEDIRNNYENYKDREITD